MSTPSTPDSESLETRLSVLFDSNYDRSKGTVLLDEQFEDNPSFHPLPQKSSRAGGRSSGT